MTGRLPSFKIKPNRKALYHLKDCGRDQETTTRVGIANEFWEISN